MCNTQRGLSSVHNMTRCLLPTFEYPPDTGGIARYLSSIVKNMPMKVEVIRLQHMRFWRIYFLLRHKLTEMHEHIFVSHVLPIGTAVFLLSLSHKIPYTICLHGMDYGLAKSSIFRRLWLRCILKRASVVMTNSEALKNEVLQDMGITAHVVYPVVEPHGNIVAQEKDHSAFELITVCRIVERKGIQHVLQALRDIQECRYTIIGDGPYKETLEKMIKQFGLQDRVEIHTNINDAEKHIRLSHADVFIMPTLRVSEDREGFGIVYIEAGLHKLPVIASDWPEIHESVIDQETGILVSNEEELKQAIIHCMTNRHLCGRLGEAGYRRAENMFVPAVMREKLQHIYG